MIEQRDLPETIANGNIALTIINTDEHYIYYSVKVDGIEKSPINLDSKYAVLLNVEAMEDDLNYYYDDEYYIYRWRHSNDKDHKLSHKTSISDLMETKEHGIILRKREHIKLSDFSHVIPE